MMRDQALDHHHHHLTVRFFFFLLLLHLSAATPSPPLNISATATFKVGLILDMTSTFGKIYRTVTRMAVDDYYAANPNSTVRLLLLPRDTSRDIVNAADAALDLLINEEVHAILGPQTSVEAPFIPQRGGEKSLNRKGRNE